MASESVVFDRAADYYDATRGFPAGEDHRIASFIAQTAGLSSASRVLEIGVGTGRVALPLAKHVGHLFGVDLSVPMLARLLRKRPDYPDGRLSVAQADITQLPAASSQFDAAVLVHILHLVPDNDRAVSELSRVLKPDGVALQCWNDSDYVGFQPLWDAWLAETHQDRPPHHYLSTSKDALADRGWQQIGTDYTHTFSSELTADAFMSRYRERVWSSTWTLPDEQWRAGVAAMEAAANVHFPDWHQPVTVQRNFYMRIYAQPSA